MKVLVTGANGFLGRHVVSEFLQRGHSVRAIVRPAAIQNANGLPQPLKNSQVDLFPADLRTSNNLPDAFTGINACVHLAAAVSGSDETQFASTVVGTEKLLAAMASAGTCQRLILASSFSVYDWSQIHGQFNEDSPLETEPDLYERDGYAVAKLWQERVARRLAAQHHWQLTILRPGFIWGKGNEDLSGIGQRVGPLQLVFGPFRRIPITHVENCAHAFVEAATHPAAVNQTFNVIDDQLPTAWRYAGEYLRRTGTRAYRIPLPYSLTYLSTRLARRVSKFLFHGKGKLPSILTPCRFQARFKPLRFTNTRLKQSLGWTPPLNFQQSLTRTYAPPVQPLFQNSSFSIQNSLPQSS